MENFRAFEYVLDGDALSDPGLGSVPVCPVSQLMSWVGEVQTEAHTL